jgi:hypothetical protein
MRCTGNCPSNLPEGNITMTRCILPSDRVLAACESYLSERKSRIADEKRAFVELLERNPGFYQPSEIEKMWDTHANGRFLSESRGAEEAEMVAALANLARVTENLEVTPADFAPIAGHYKPPVVLPPKRRESLGDVMALVDVLPPKQAVVVVHLFMDTDPKDLNKDPAWPRLLAWMSDNFDILIGS